MEGYIYKLDKWKAGLLQPGWRRVYALLRGSTLYYYADAPACRTGAHPTKRDVKQVVSARPIDSPLDAGQRVAAPPGVATPCYLLVFTDKAEKLLCAESAEEQAQWASAIQVGGSLGGAEPLLRESHPRSDAAAPAPPGIHAPKERDLGFLEGAGRKPSMSEQSMGAGETLDEASVSTASTVPSQAALPALRLPAAKGREATGSKEPAATARGLGYNPFSHGGVMDRLLEHHVDKVLGKVGAYVAEEFHDPHMPLCLQRGLDRTFRDAWPGVQTELRNWILESYAKGDREARLYRELRLKHWASRPPSWRRPFARVRALLLHALEPADATLWQVLRDPVAVGIWLLSFTPTCALNVLVFVLFFVLIDKKDELVNFILKFKASQFVSSGLVSATYASLRMFECAMLQSCATSAPGTHATFPFEIAMEPVREALIWAAFGLLWGGHARGGIEEILALEEVRLDAADGSLDGTRDLARLRRVESVVAERASFNVGRLQAVTDMARRRYGAQRRSGGVLPYFLVYDVCAAGASCLAIAAQIRLLGLRPDTWMFWTALYYMKVLYALLSFPFLVFGLWPEPLTHARPTGYDRAGTLCAALTSYEVKEKYRLEQLRKAEAAEARRKLQRRAAGRTPAQAAATLLQARWVGKMRVAKATAAAVTPADAQAARRAARLDAHGTLEVHLVGARALYDNHILGHADPYVKVRVAGHKRQSQVVRQSQNPDWDERLLFKGRLRDFAADALLLKVRDGSDRLGEVSAPLAPLADAPGTTLRFAERPLDFDPGGSATLTFAVAWTWPGQ